MSEARTLNSPRITVLPATRNRFTAMPIASTRKRRVAAYARVSTDSEEQMTSYLFTISLFIPTLFFANRPHYGLDIIT